MLYLIKVNIILALLCLLFLVVMHRDTFFGVRRAMLWGIYLTALLLPLWNVQSWLQGDTAAMHVASDYATYVLPSLEVTATRVASMGIHQQEPGCGLWFVGMLALWGLIYLIPVVWMTLKLLWQFAYILYIRCTCRREGAYFRYPRPCSPFSFGPWIFLNPDGMDEQTQREVLIHEQAHIRGWHTLDILFSQLVCILFWWNPATWVLRREVRLNLEFIADKAVADFLSPSLGEGTGVDPALKAYQYRLLGFATQTNVATIANNFNVLPLKRRIVMMNLKRTRRTGMVKYILFVPAAAALLLLSNVDALARSIKAKVKPLAHIEQAITTPQTIASVMEDVQPTAEKPIVEQIELIVEETSDVQDSVVSEATSPKALNLVHLHDKALWVIDNIVSTKEDAAKLNADDIESIAVLEDSAATSVWGSRGANGVIVIKTKNASMDGGDAIYAEVEQMPNFPGGDNILYKWLTENIKYPAVAQEVGIQGQTFVSFIVEKDGSISEVSAHRTADPNAGHLLAKVIKTTKRKQPNQEIENGEMYLDKEVMRVVSWMPRWQPGEQDGKPVRVRFTLPVVFRLR